MLWGDFEAKRVLRPAKCTNEAFIMKLSWDVVRNSQSLWVDVLKAKYDVGSWSGQVCCLWKAIQKQEQQVLKGVAWVIGNGRNVTFWLDS